MYQVARIIGIIFAVILIVLFLVVSGIAYTAIALIASILYKGLGLEQQFRNWRARISNEPTIRRHLDAGFAGNLKSRKIYEAQRIIRKVDIPPWVQRRVDTTIRLRYQAIRTPHETLLQPPGFGSDDKILLQQLYHPATKYRREKTFPILDRKRYASKNLTMWKFMPSEILELSAKQQEMQKAEWELYRCLQKELTPLICKSVALEDTLWVHPYDLTPREKEEIVEESETIWEIISHPVMQSIIQAEGELQDLFQKYRATTQERNHAIRLFLARGFTTKSKEKVDEWFKARRPKPQIQKPKATIAAATVKNTVPVIVIRNFRQEVRSFVRGLTELSRAQQNHIMHLALKLHGAGILNMEESLAELTEYTGKDHDAYWERRYLELSAVEEEELSQPTRPLVRPVLLPAETTEVILARLRDDSQKIATNDITSLRKMLNQGQIKEDLLDEVLGHLLCFRLAHDGKNPRKTGPYKIRLRTLTKRYLHEHYVPRGEKILASLVASGRIVHRDNRSLIPKPADPVKLCPQALYQYK